jgi:hypothetical protein
MDQKQYLITEEQRAAIFRHIGEVPAKYVVPVVDILRNLPLYVTHLEVAEQPKSE